MTWPANTCAEDVTPCISHTGRTLIMVIRRPTKFSSPRTPRRASATHLPGGIPVFHLNGFGRLRANKRWPVAGGPTATIVLLVRPSPREYKMGRTQLRAQVTCPRGGRILLSIPDKRLKVKEGARLSSNVNALSYRSRRT